MFFEIFRSKFGRIFGSSKHFLRQIGESLDASADSATFCHSNEFGDGLHSHLLHHVGTMDFDRLLDGAQLAGNLFVQFASNDVFEHFPLTRCERRSEEHTSELQSHLNLVCRLLLEKKKHRSERVIILELVWPLLMKITKQLYGLNGSTDSVGGGACEEFKTCLAKSARWRAVTRNAL